jgi:hypothetical protein
MFDFESFWIIFMSPIAIFFTAVAIGELYLYIEQARENKS